MRLREALGTIYEDEMCADLFSPTGRPAEAPWRLALVCLLQFVEDLSDRQAAEAVRARIDWKYLLGLELTDVGFDFSVLSEFRARLLRAEAGARLFERLVEKLSEGGWIKKRGVQRDFLDACAGGGSSPQPRRAARRTLARVSAPLVAHVTRGRGLAQDVAQQLSSGKKECCACATKILCHLHT